MVHWVHSSELFILNVTHHASKFLLSPATGDSHSVTTSEQFSTSERSGLIIYDFSFFSGSLLRWELSPDAAVSNHISCTHNWEPAHLLDDKHTNTHHYWVHHSSISFHGNLSTLWNVTKSHKHVDSGDADLIKWTPSIVFRLVTNFRTEIAALYSGSDFPCVNVSYLDHESLDTIVIIINEEASKDNSMTCEATEIAWPVFSCSYVWGMNDELICIFIQSCRSLKTRHIWTVPDFSLSVASQNINISDHWKPSSLLLLVG